MPRIAVPVWTTYVRPDEVEDMHRGEVQSYVNAVFHRMVAHGSPIDPNTIDQGNFGSDLEPLRESLTLFMTAWCNLMTAYTGSNEPVEYPQQVIPAWKVWLVRWLFRKPHPSTMIRYLPK
jgi:hypothetical protein